MLFTPRKYPGTSPGRSKLVISAIFPVVLNAIKHMADSIKLALLQKVSKMPEEWIGNVKKHTTMHAQCTVYKNLAGLSPAFMFFWNYYPMSLLFIFWGLQASAASQE